MATSAESDTEVGISSDEIDRRWLCKPCREEGGTLTAVGFCVNCSEHLCLKCYDVHLIPSITRKHVLQRHAKEHSTEAVEECKYSCPQHRDKDIEYHCPVHFFLGCHVCCFRHQKSCKDVIFIPDFTMSSSGSSKFDQFYQNLNNISSKCSDLVTEIRDNLEIIPSKHSKTITALREFKQEIIDMIDTLEKERIKKINGQQKKEITRMEELSVKCEVIMKEALELSAAMEMLQNKEQSRELYIERVHSENKVINMQEQVSLIEKDKTVSMPVYKPNKDLLEYLMKPSSLGSLNMKRPVIEKLNYVQDINCKSKHDAGYCIILGSVILPGHKLVVTDCLPGNTVKLIDTKQNKIVSDLKLSSYTWALCKITDTSVAVTLPDDKKIAFLKVGHTLSKDKEISLNGTPWGIGHLDGTLVVSYCYPHEVELMDMQGRVAKTVTTDDNGQHLFDFPFLVAIGNNNNIYVSNFSTHKVVCLNIDGAVVATYKDNELIQAYPRQVTFDSSGMVYTANKDHTMYIK